MGKRKILSIIIGVVVIAAMIIPAVSCSSSTETVTATSTVTSTVTATATATGTATATATATTTSGGARPKGWSITIDDIPEVANKNPIHIGLLAGAVPEKIVGYIDAVAAKMGVTITHEFLGAALMYSKINTEIVAQSGAYDVINPESTLSNEWAPYMLTMKELADKYEPGGYQSFLTDMEGHSKAMMRCTADANGNIYGEPFYRYTQTIQYRRDIFENATEKAAFKAKYGYDLAPATTWG